MTLLRFVLIFLGTLSLFIGVIGVFIPGLPTTPFLLLTAILYTKSSNRLYNMVIENKYIGAYIIRYRANRGMKKKEKIFSISLMWLMIALSCTLFIDATMIRLVVILLGLIGTIVMGLIVPLSK
ncbi:MAG TPA: DUF454 domain-containing protein [Bacteroidales bacterium]|nr:DUF454 domain-containing protein [Bacteroidales bacterium]